VIQFHGLKPRCKKALWIVILSSKVTTRKYRPPCSRQAPQNLYRLCSWGLAEFPRFAAVFPDSTGLTFSKKCVAGVLIVVGLDSPRAIVID
jgi:urea transporter